MDKSTKAVDRGGLVHISARFFLAVEYATQRHLRISNIASMHVDESFHNEIVSLVIGDSDVEFYWCLTGIEDENAGELVLKKLVHKWITIQGFSFRTV